MKPTNHQTTGWAPDVLYRYGGWGRENLRTWLTQSSLTCDGLRRLSPGGVQPFLKQNLTTLGDKPPHADMKQEEMLDCVLGLFFVVEWWCHCGLFHSRMNTQLFVNNKCWTAEICTSYINDPNVIISHWTRGCVLHSDNLLPHETKTDVISLSFNITRLKLQLKNISLCLIHE